MNKPEGIYDLIVIGGGAAGFFSAITAAEAGTPNVLILERGSEVLTKVRISGGGRCNVTHDCDDPRDLVRSYPRGEKNLRGPFHRWQATDTMEWFEERGVALKVEEDGRMFPVTDRSQTVIDCLTDSARTAGVRWRTHCGVSNVRCLSEGFEVDTTTKETYRCRNLLIATGGIRSKEARTPVESTGHTMISAVPSLFTFKIDDPRLEDLMGVSVPDAKVTIGRLESSGPLLITHWGLSGPAVLKASAWGARELAKSNYQFSLVVNWTGSESRESVSTLFETQRTQHGARKVLRRSVVEGITRRLWQRMCEASGIDDETTWARMTKVQAKALTEELVAAKYEVRGKSLNKDEFVTCGGVPLDDLHLKTMESKLVPGLFFAGEVLNVDGITGGFNFQAAWTTGRLAGLAIAERSL